MTKKENVLEKCRINLDKEKVLHSITRGEKEELQERIDKAIKCLNYYTCNKEFLSVEEQELYEILKEDGSNEIVK